MPRPVRINLACGTDIRDGWVNLDIVPKWPLARRGCDVVWDARRDRLPFVDGCVDEVYAGYLFLHLAPHHHARVLADVHRVMKPGARLVVGEVDMRLVMARWLADPADARVAELIWGEQGALPGADNAEQQALAEFDKHCHGYDEGSLRAFLARGGFTQAQRINVHHRDVWWELTLEVRK